MVDINEVSIFELQPDPNNLNMGTELGLNYLEKSLRRFGAGRSILIDRKGKVMAGNKTLGEAADLGFESVIVVPSDGTKLIAVQRMDLDLDNDPEGLARGLALADNRVAEVDLAIDNLRLVALSQEQPEIVNMFYGEMELLNRAGVATGPREEDPEKEIIITCPCCGCKLTVEGRKVTDGQTS